MHHARLCRIVDDKVRLELLQLLLRRADEHIRHEMRLPRHLHDETHRHARVLVRAAERVDHEEALVAQLADRDLAHGVPSLLRRAVIVVLVLGRRPPNRVMRCLVVHNVFILRRTSRVDARHHVDGVAHLRDLPALISLEIGTQLFAEKLVVTRVVNNLGRACNAILCEINRCHDTLPLSPKRLE